MIQNSTAINSSALQQGLTGIQKSSQSMLESANELVRSGTTERPVATTDIVEPLVNINKQQHLFDASAKVVKMADDALGALIDIKS